MTRRAILGARYDASLARQVFAMLDALERDLVAQIAVSDVQGAGLTARRARLDRLLRITREQIRDTYRRIELLSDNDLTALATLEAGATRDILGKAFVDLGAALGVGLPTDATMAALTEDKLVMGAPLKDWWAGQNAQLSKDFAAQMRIGVMAGERVDDLARRVAGGMHDGLPVRGIMPTSKTWARTLVRTSVASVQNEARAAVYRANTDVVSELVHISRLDSRTTPICIARAGLTWDAQTLKPTGGHRIPFENPPLHLNCLPGHSLVSPGGAISGASKRWIDGDLIVVRTAAGRELAATPNHPILTERGWIGAARLKKGDHVICIGRAQGALGRIGYDEDVKASIQEVAETTLRASAMCAVPVPVAAPDFHGDGAESEIAVVATKRGLLLERQPAFRQPLSEEEFRLRDGEQSTLTRDGPAALLGAGHGASAGGGMSLREHLLALLGGGGGPTGAHLIGHSLSILGASPTDRGRGFGRARSAGPADDLEHSAFADTEARSDLMKREAVTVGADDFVRRCLARAGLVQRHSTPPQKCADGSWADAALFRELLRRRSGEVARDEIVSVRRVPFSGHVFNLETQTGWFAAEGIITHNCRSVIGVHVIGGQMRVDQDGQAWLSRLDAEAQNDVLGPGRAELFRDGKIQVGDLIDQSNRPLTLAELRGLNS